MTRRVLTEAEHIAMMDAEHERRLRENPRPPLPPQKHAKISVFRQFIQVRSMVHTGVISGDPDGYLRYLDREADDLAHQPVQR